MKSQRKLIIKCQKPLLIHKKGKRASAHRYNSYSVPFSISPTVIWGAALQICEPNASELQMSLLQRTLLWCCGFSQHCWNTSKHPGGPKMLCQIKLNQWIPLQDPPHFQTDPGPVRSPLAAQSQRKAHRKQGRTGLIFQEKWIRRWNSNKQHIHAVRLLFQMCSYNGLIFLSDLT